MIAMGYKPSQYKVLDYSMRWDIECLFSGFKSRGFSITKTQIKKTDRIERLILILTIALYWAVSTGMKPGEKKDLDTQKIYRSLISLFKRALRIIFNAALSSLNIPKRWKSKNYVGQ